MEYYTQMEFLRSSPPAQTFKPPCKNVKPLLKTFWRRFCLYFCCFQVLTELLC